MDCPQGEKWPLKRGGLCKEDETRFSVWTVSAKEKKNHCRGVAVDGRCVEVVVSGGSTVFRNSSECLIQINRTLHNVNLTSTSREKPNEFSSLQSKGDTTKWTLKD